MKLIKLLCVITLVLVSNALPSDLSTCDLVRAAGLPCEIKHVTTDDNYVLQLEHIPNPGRPVALFMHGLHMNAGCWTANRRDNTMSFMAHDAGFDVWFINFRGTNPSQSNTKIPPSDRLFWQYSWTEFALHDLPSTVDYIHYVTGKYNVTLVGHSEGGATLFAALSMLPRLRSRVTLGIALSPAVYITNMKSMPFKIIKDVHGMELLDKVGVTKVGPGAVANYFDETACHLMQTVCELTFSVVAGWDFSSENVNKSRLDVYATRLDVSSVHNWVHGMQCARSGVFRLFDFGDTDNMVKYGQPTPPEFPLSHIDTPIALYYGSADTLVDPYDIETYLVPNLTHAKMTTIKKLEWNHADFVFGVNVAPFREMISTMSKFNNM